LIFSGGARRLTDPAGWKPAVRTGKDACVPGAASQQQKNIRPA